MCPSNFNKLKSWLLGRLGGKLTDSRGHDGVSLSIKSVDHQVV
jgi:hypothetical protein